MLSTILAALLFTIPPTLAHPTKPLQPRQATYPQANLILTPYTGPACKADTSLSSETDDSPIDVQYSLNNAVPMRSYNLNRTLLSDELLDFSTSVSSEAYEGFDIANSGGPDLECAVSLGHADATEREAGCHTLEVYPSVECFRLWRPGIDPEAASDS